MIEIDNELLEWLGKEKDDTHVESFVIGELLVRLSEKLSELKKQEENLFEIAKADILNHKNHQNESKTLSKVFRKTLNFKLMLILGKKIKLNIK
mgnify:CR=1 FL=1